MGAGNPLALVLLFFLASYIALSPNVLLANASTATGSLCSGYNYLCASAYTSLPGPSSTEMISGQPLSLGISVTSDLGEAAYYNEPYYFEIDAIPYNQFNGNCSDYSTSYALTSGWIYGTSDSLSYTPPPNSRMEYCLWAQDLYGDYVWLSHGPVQTFPPLSITAIGISPQKLSGGQSLTAGASWTGDTGPYDVYLEYGTTPGTCTDNVANADMGTYLTSTILDASPDVNTSGTYYFCIEVVGSLGSDAVSQPVAVNVSENLAIDYFLTTSTVVTGDPIYMISAVSGGTPPYVGKIYQCPSADSCVGGKLIYSTAPDPSGTIAATTTAQTSTGSEYFQESVTDSVGTTVQSTIDAVEVNAPLSIQYFNLPERVTAGEYIYVASAVSGGSPPYTASVMRCGSSDCSVGGPIVYWATLPNNDSDLSGAIPTSVPGMEYFRESAVDSEGTVVLSAIARVDVMQPASPPPAPPSNSPSDSAHDEQIGMTFTTNTASLSYDVPAIAQQDATGAGPAYLVNGFTNKGYWYQVGLLYNWSKLMNGHQNGFYYTCAVFAPSGQVLFFPSTKANVKPGDKVRIALYIYSGNVVMNLYDQNTEAQQTWTYDAFGANTFIGSPDSSQINGDFSGLMTEWYHTQPYNGSVGFTNAQPVSYSPSSTWPSGPIWQWAAESPSIGAGAGVSGIVLFGLDVLERSGGVTTVQAGDTQSQYNSATGVFTTSQIDYVPPPQHASSSYALGQLAQNGTANQTQQLSNATSMMGNIPIGAIPIAIMNSQTSNTTANFQQMIQFNPRNTIYSANESADLGNIRFYQGPQELYSWCESGCNASASNSVFWVRLPGGIGANSDTVVYMTFLPTNTEYDGIYAGEAPQLTCNNPSNTIGGCAAGQYGKYDNGASVFARYWNFAGTSMPPGWTTGSSTVDNGLTGKCTQSPGTIIFIPQQMCGGSTYTTNTFVPPYVAESYTETLTYNNAVGTADGAWGFGVLTNNNGCVSAYSKPYSNPFIYQFGSVFDLTYAGYISCGYEGATAQIYGPPVPVATGAFYTYRIMGDSPNRFDVAILQGTTPLWAATETNWQYSNSGYLSLGGINTGDSGRTYWVRTRAAPPNGTMPSSYFGAEFAPMTRPTVKLAATSSEAGAFITLNSVWSGGTAPYSVYLYQASGGSCSLYSQNSWLGYITTQHPGLNVSLAPVPWSNSTATTIGSYCISVFDNSTNKYVPMNSTPSAPVTFAPSLTQPTIGMTPNSVVAGRTAVISSKWLYGKGPYTVTIKSSANQTNCSAGAKLYQASVSANSISYTTTPPQSAYYCVQVKDSLGANATSNTTMLGVYLAAPTITNTTLDIGQSATLSDAISASKGPFTANFIYCESPVDALVAPGYLCNGTVANTLTGVSAGGTAKYVFRPTSSGVYVFNVLAANAVTTFNSTKVTIMVLPTPSATAPSFSNAVIGVGQSTTLSTAVSGGEGPFTVNFIYTNGTLVRGPGHGQGGEVIYITNTVSGITGIRIAAFNFVPKLAGTYTFNVVINDMGDTTPFTFNTANIVISVASSPMSANAPTPTNSILDIGQSTTMSSVISGSGGPFTANFVYYNGMVTAYKYPDGTVVYAYPSGTVANTLTGIPSGGTARYTFTPSSAGPYAFNVVASNSVVAFSSARTPITVNPTPYASALNATGSTISQGQSTILSTTISGGTGPFTVKFVYYNGTVANSVTGIPSGGTAAFNFAPASNGTYAFNAVIADTGPTTAFLFNSTRIQITVIHKIHIVPAVPVSLFTETGLPANAMFTIQTLEPTGQLINHTIEVNSSRMMFAIYEARTDFPYIIPNVTFSNTVYAAVPNQGKGYWWNNTNVTFTAIASGMGYATVVPADGLPLNSSINTTIETPPAQASNSTENATS